MQKGLRQDYSRTFQMAQPLGLRYVSNLSLTIGFLLIFSSALHSQMSNLSVPFVTNHSKSSYKAGAQNWGIIQSENDLLYFANNEGLLTYDGEEWELFPLPNKTRVRVIKLKGDKIYVGGQGEIGFFQPNPEGILQYHSLLNRIDESDRQFSDVWDIMFLEEELYFRTENKLYHLSESASTTITSPALIKISHVYKDTILVFLKDLGLYKVNQNRYEPIDQSLKFKNEPIVHVSSQDDQLVIITQSGIWFYKDGLLIRQTMQADTYFQKHRIRSAIYKSNGSWTFGTETGGVIFLGPNFRVTHIINRDNGLQNNYVHYMLEDKHGQLWLGLENGIDQLLTDQPLGKITPDGQLEGKAFAAYLHKEHLYLGTTNGLYVKEWKSYYSPQSDQQFELIPGTQGQVWGLNAIDDQLWLGHNKGVFLVEGKTAKNIWSETGAWKFISMGNVIVVGTYQGILAISKNGSQWNTKWFVKDFNESSRIIEKESDNILWVSHPYRGIFKLTFDKNHSTLAEVKSFGLEQGVPNELNNYIFSIHQQLLVGTQAGILKYNKQQGRFEPFELYNQYLGAENWIQRLYEDDKGNIWYVKNNHPGILRIEDVGLERKIEHISFGNLQEDLVGGFEFIYPINQENTLIGTERGFVQLDPSQLKNVDTLVQVSIYGAYLTDSLVYSNKYLNSEKDKVSEFSFPSNTQSARFSFGNVNLTSNKEIEFRHQLIGAKGGWSNWSEKREKEFSNMSHGDYEFQVQARDESGNLSSIESYAFNIQAPWYASLVAKVIYGILSFALIAGLILVPRSRHKKEKAELETAFTSEIEKTQEEIILLQNKNLASEIKYKNQELASATMHWAQKGEMLRGIRSHLEKIIQDKPESNLVFKNLRSLVRSIERDSQLDESWDQFANHFDEVHSNFLKRLKETHPAISNNDLKLCAYLKMNLSTKEIAPLLNISIRGVEASRYRLRKKMELEKTVNLVDYIMNF